MTERDTTRGLVYAAENQWSAALDRGGVIDFFGSRLTLPKQEYFETVESMQHFCDGVLAAERITASFPGAGMVLVRARAGHTKAHYECESKTIAVPLSGSAGVPGWACCEAVLLHELTHHLLFVSADPAASAQAYHGGRFTTTMCWLVSGVLGPESALVLQGAYQGVGVIVDAYVN
ncbi:MAG: TIGR04338 family metallohydrolase [Actinomycetota bacterium]|nr:TIGR04338 family metallohydrolase [Actinomycetota bacterium]